MGRSPSHESAQLTYSDPAAPRIAPQIRRLSATHHPRSKLRPGGRRPAVLDLLSLWYKSPWIAIAAPNKTQQAGQEWTGVRAIMRSRACVRVCVSESEGARWSCGGRSGGHPCQARVNTSVRERSFGRRVLSIRKPQLEPAERGLHSSYERLALSTPSPSGPY